MKKVTNLTKPPIIGETYLVPCIYTDNVYITGAINEQPATTWYPVFTPSHEDSEFGSQKVMEIKEVDNVINVFDRFIPNDKPIPKYQHHYHGDPRFLPEECYPSLTQSYLQNGYSGYSGYRLIFTVFQEDKVTFREMVCLREMPEVGKLYNIFGSKFINKFKDSQIKCDKCPHKGINLRSMPIIEGVITCPAHGLKFDSKTLKCKL